MSRELDEIKHENILAGNYPRGDGDPDWYGYPGQPEKGVKIEQVESEPAPF